MGMELLAGRNFNMAVAMDDATLALRIARRLRGDRIVTCPETGRAAAVASDVGADAAPSIDAALGTSMGGGVVATLQDGAAPGNDPRDYEGHGSHVAGTIGAQGNNAANVAGEPFPALFGAFGIATYTDSIDGVARTSVPTRYRFTSRNTRQVFGRLYPTKPIESHR